MSLPTSTAPLSPANTLVNGKAPEPRYTNARRYMLLICFCVAQFMDAFNNSALFPAIPSLVKNLDMTISESTWIISAYQLTFASFLLISGRISDVYNPKQSFIAGLSALGILSIGLGFVNNKITLIVLRAVSGIAASLTIPSALTLLVNMFPESKEQARAIGVFGGCGAIGNVLGLIIGSIFVQFASWSWVFWFVALVVIPVACICLFFIPSDMKEAEDIATPQSQKWKNLDLVGVSILTVALILFIFAVTSASATGWATSRVLAPLIISVAMVAGFFYYESLISASTASIPPNTWFLPNFAVLFGVALMPFFWWATIFTMLTTLWQDVYGWSVISTALRMLPIGILAFPVSFSESLSRLTSPKWVLLSAQGLLIIATTLLALADSPSKYFPYVLPGFILGTTGAMLTYTHTNIAIFRTSPSSMAGTVGAIFNCALQLGSAVGLAAVTSIQTSVEAKHGGERSYSGRAAAFWFLLGIVIVEAIAILVFYRMEAEVREGTSVGEELPETKVQPTQPEPIMEKGDAEELRQSTASQV